MTPRILIFLSCICTAKLRLLFAAMHSLYCTSYNQWYACLASPGINSMLGLNLFLAFFGCLFYRNMLATGQLIRWGCCPWNHRLYAGSAVNPTQHHAVIEIIRSHTLAITDTNVAIVGRDFSRRRTMKGTKTSTKERSHICAKSVELVFLISTKCWDIKGSARSNKAKLPLPEKLNTWTCIWMVA